MAVDKDLVPLFDFVGSEKDLEEYILEEIETISENCKWGGIKSIEQQYRIPFGNTHLITDLMLFHDNGTATIIEVKGLSRNKNSILGGVMQLLSYGMKIEAITGYKPRLVLVAPEINPDVGMVIAHYNLPISLMMVDGDRVVYLNDLKDAV